MSKQILTQDRLKELLHYDPETGLFCRLKVTSPTGPLGIVNNKHNGIGYSTLRIDGRLYYQHRLAFLYINGCFPSNEVDHINHDRADNRWCNMRQATHQENLKNLNRAINNTSGITGVMWCPVVSKWYAQITNSQKHIHLGFFDVKSDAAMARKKAEAKYGFHINHGLCNEPS